MDGVFEGFRLSPRLDREALAEAFAARGRLQIDSVLDEASAEALGAAIEGERSWSRSVRMTSGTFSAPLDGYEPVHPNHRQWLAEAIPDAEDRSMQWLFDARRFSQERRLGMVRGDVLDALFDFLNGDDFLGLGRDVTRDSRAAAVEAQVTRYRPGDFLTLHSDKDAGGRRLCAYVLNMTRDWRADWGGLLLFHDAAGNVAEGFTPGFNQLNLFRVPMDHSVSQVASFAPRDRYAVSGWLLAPA